MVSVDGLTVEFGGTTLFSDVSFVINDKDRTHHQLPPQSPPRGHHRAKTQDHQHRESAHDELSTFVARGFWIRLVVPAKPLMSLPSMIPGEMKGLES